MVETDDVTCFQMEYKKEGNDVDSISLFVIYQEYSANQPEPVSHFIYTDESLNADVYHQVALNLRAGKFRIVIAWTKQQGNYLNAAVYIDNIQWSMMYCTGMALFMFKA